jgi:8-oxo-dGTP pyrophosphatase MutT (NUDIX family)
MRTTDAELQGTRRNNWEYDWIVQPSLKLQQPGEFCTQNYLQKKMARHTRYQGLIVENDRVLLIKHREHETGRSYWIIPGGGLDGDESEEECVIREVREETNLDVEVLDLLFDEPGHPDGVYRWRKTFLCKPVGGNPSPGYEPELEAAEIYSITEVRWFDLRDEAEWGHELLTDPFTYPQLVNARKELGYAPK